MNCKTLRKENLNESTNDVTGLCKQTMIDSYARISFYGERRGEEDYNYYCELLANDLDQLGDNQGNYKEKFISKVMAIYHRQSNCTSSFIVGPANYNIRRHEKAWNSRDNAYNHFEQWRAKYFKAVNRVRTLGPEDEIESAIADIDRLLKYQAKAKETNKIIRRHKVKLGINFDDLKDNEKAAINDLKELWGEDKSAELLVGDCFNNLGFASFTLTSISTKIRERRKKIEVMKSRIEAKNNQEDIFFNGGKIFIENDRVIIQHDNKPEREVIDAIKSNGFRWSPKFKSWCRKHTANARRDANYLLNNVFGGQLKQD